MPTTPPTPAHPARRAPGRTPGRSGHRATHRRDIENAVRAGRFTVRDVDLAMVIVAGAALCLGQLLHDHPERDDATAADQVAEDLVRMPGVPAEEAREICQRPLPGLDAFRPTSETAGQR